MDIVSGINWSISYVEILGFEVPVTWRHYNEFNRSDLLWDNYDGTMATNNTDINHWLSNLNSIEAYSGKIIFYRGYINPQDQADIINLLNTDDNVYYKKAQPVLDALLEILSQRNPILSAAISAVLESGMDTALKYATLFGYASVGDSESESGQHTLLTVANILMSQGLCQHTGLPWYLCNGALPYIYNDGLVPLQSASLSGQNLVRRNYEGYDHLDMKNGKYENGTIPLFNKIKDDLLSTTDTTPPTISITSPTNTNSQTVSGSLTVLVSPDSDVKRVEYYLGNSTTVNQTVKSSPFSWAFDTATISNGLLKITYDAAGNQSLPATVTVTVSNDFGNKPPDIPASLIQYKSDGTGLAAGATINERIAVMKGRVSDPDSDPVSLEVEIQPTGISFTDNPSANCTPDGPVSSGGTAVVVCSGLADGQYHWQARAKDDKNAVGLWQSAGGNLESAHDIVVAATSVVNRPPTVTIISPNGGELLTSGSNYTISWRATDDKQVNSIGLSFSLDGGAAWMPIPGAAAVANAGNFQWTVPSAVTSSTARIKISAYDGELTGIGISNSNFGIVTNCATPSFPNLQNIATSGSGYNVTWSAVSSADYYNLQEDTSSSFSSPSVVYASNGPSWYSGEKMAGTYYYRVKAINNCGISSWSDVQSTTIQANIGPGAVTVQSPADRSTNQPLNVTLSWDAGHPGGQSLKYNVYVSYSNLNEFFSGNIRSQGQTSKTYALSNIPYNTTVSWGIEAIDEMGVSRFSNMSHFTTVGDNSAPTGSLLINNGAAETATYSVTLSLSASDSESGVRYMRFSNDGMNWTNWMGFMPQYAWNIADSSYGGQTGRTNYFVYAQFQDYQSNVSSVYSASINKKEGTPGNIILNGRLYETIQDAINVSAKF